MKKVPFYRVRAPFHLPINNTILKNDAEESDLGDLLFEVFSIPDNTEEAASDLGEVLFETVESAIAATLKCLNFVAKDYRNVLPSENALKDRLSVREVFPDYVEVSPKHTWILTRECTSVSISVKTDSIRITLHGRYQVIAKGRKTLRSKGIKYMSDTTSITSEWMELERTQHNIFIVEKEIILY